jgi:hypothetical protein
MASKRQTILVAGLGVLLALGSTASAHAWSKSFGGTRDQVRTACAKVGGEVIEGKDSNGIGTTACLSKTTGLVCGDDGKCSASGSGPMPRTASFGDVLLFGAYAPSKPYTPPQSLIESSSDSAGAAPAGAPAGGASGGGGGGPVIIY